MPWEIDRKSGLLSYVVGQETRYQWPIPRTHAEALGLIGQVLGKPEIEREEVALLFVMVSASLP